MKVIDLLNKIANGEEIPKKVKVGYYYYEYEENGEYINTENTEDLLFDFDSYYPLEQCLNEEVEIVGEDKNIEKLEIVHNGSANAYALLNEYGTKCALTKHSKVMCDKINEIIDKLNEMEKE